ncbi:hypothetical protein EW026_g4634 [Hermanssonia centrifuga]|uniref:RNB domain-containing protein n=1 Tax=Hermanssonia centrifuga TaxID=98765 RepID=A0A4S4KL05_9APHY|nr:hypothetical protein EW026_g4634 [Hermanssonia centrifuga]
MIITHGVIVRHEITDSVPMLCTLVSTGEVWEHNKSDVMFVVPNFVDRVTVERCGVSEVGENEHEINSRISVLKKIRELEKDIETHFQTHAAGLNTALASLRLRSRDAHMELTTEQAARMITKGPSIPLVTLLTVHKYLMRRPQMFVAHPQHFLTTQTFTVRPMAEVEVLERVSRMVTKKEKSLRDFIDKARSIIEASRAEPSSSGPLSMKPIEGYSFTEDDQVIIRFLQFFMRPIRSTQNNPFIVPTATIMKRLDMYRDGTVDAAMVHQMLIDLGVLSPWDDPISREKDAIFTAAEPAFVSDPPPAPISAISSSDTVGPDEFYPRDIVAHLRHDFGDMPVYVIDDAGAQELDDGISLERIPSEPGCYWIHVHIADPTLLLHPNHSISKKARARMGSLYLVHETVPMLPPSVMRAGLSLGSGQAEGRPETVLTFGFKIDEQGDIVDYVVRPGLIRNVHVIQYDDLDRALGIPLDGTKYPFGGNPPVSSLAHPIPQDQLDDLTILLQVSGRLIAQRHKLGSFSIGSPQAGMEMLPKPALGNPPDLNSPYAIRGFPNMRYSICMPDKFDKGARSIVSECMKAASRVASRFFRDLGIPAIRRASGSLVVPSAADRESILSIQKNGFVNRLEITNITFSIPEAEYTLLPKGHWPLGIADGEGYTRVTSPLRRYGDVVAHWQIKHALLAPSTGSNGRLFSDEWLKSLATEMALKESQLKGLEKRHMKFWALMYLKRRMEHPAEFNDSPDVLQSLQGGLLRAPYINHMTGGFQAHVMVDSLGLKGVLERLHPKMHLHLGTTCDLQISNIRLGPNPEISLKVRH